MTMATSAAGAFAGLIATGPMTLVMLALHRRLPCRERHSLPPRQITAHLVDEVGVARYLDREGQTALTWLLHFGYGAGAGALYGRAVSLSVRPRLLTGALFGVAIWAGSYFGWLPLLDIHGHGLEQSPRRNALMLVAHVIWGVTLGALVRALTGWRDKTSATPSWMAGPRRRGPGRPDARGSPAGGLP